MNSDQAAVVGHERRRPWWLVADTYGRAVYYGLFSLFQAWLLFTVNRNKPLQPLWYIGGFALIAANLVASAATIVAFMRHPDWVNKAWPKRVLNKRVKIALAAGVGIGAVITVVGVIVAVITFNGIAIAVTLIGFSVAAGCGAVLSVRKDSAEPFPL